MPAESTAKCKVRENRYGQFSRRGKETRTPSERLVIKCLGSVVNMSFGVWSSNSNCDNLRKNNQQSDNSSFKLAPSGSALINIQTDAANK